MKNKFSKNKKAKTALKNPWFYFSVILVIVVLFLFYKGMKLNFQETSLTETGLDSFAQCLTEKELKMYGTEWCPHCKNQKALFGTSFEFIDYTDCDQERDICITEEIQGYPTWKINGNSYPGEQSLERLAQLSECEL